MIRAPYDGVIAECCYSAVGSDVKSGTLLCRVAVLESIFVYNSQGAGKNLRFGMDVDLVINDVDYKGTVTAAPDTAPSDASKDATTYCAVTLSDDSLKKLINDNNPKKLSRRTALKPIAVFFRATRSTIFMLKLERPQADMSKYSADLTRAMW